MLRCGQLPDERSEMPRLAVGMLQRFAASGCATVVCVAPGARSTSGNFDRCPLGIARAVSRIVDPEHPALVHLDRLSCYQMVGASAVCRFSGHPSDFLLACNESFLD